VILRLVPQQIIHYSHFSPPSGLPDAPKNYHTVRITLSEKATQTFLSWSHDNNPTEKSREHSEKNWKMMLERLKTPLER
jgi:Activator of Hsp90 ATPase homolog 1-like protein